MNPLALVQRIGQQVAVAVQGLAGNSGPGDELPNAGKHGMIDISSHQWLRREFEKDLFFLWNACHSARDSVTRSI